MSIQMRNTKEWNPVKPLALTSSLQVTQELQNKLNDTTQKQRQIQTGILYRTTDGCFFNKSIVWRGRRGEEKRSVKEKDELF